MLSFSNFWLFLWAQGAFSLQELTNHEYEIKFRIKNDRWNKSTFYPYSETNMLRDLNPDTELNFTSFISENKVAIDRFSIALSFTRPQNVSIVHTIIQMPLILNQPESCSQTFSFYLETGEMKSTSLARQCSDQILSTVLFVGKKVEKFKFVFKYNTEIRLRKSPTVKEIGLYSQKEDLKFIPTPFAVPQNISWKTDPKRPRKSNYRITSPGLTAESNDSICDGDLISGSNYVINTPSGFVYDVQDKYSTSRGLMFKKVDEKARIRVVCVSTLQTHNNVFSKMHRVSVFGLYDSQFPKEPYDGLGESSLLGYLDRDRKCFDASRTVGYYKHHKFFILFLATPVHSIFLTEVKIYTKSEWRHVRPAGDEDPIEKPPCEACTCNCACIGERLKLYVNLMQHSQCTQACCIFRTGTESLSRQQLGCQRSNEGKRGFYLSDRKRKKKKKPERY